MMILYLNLVLIIYCILKICRICDRKNSEYSIEKTTIQSATDCEQLLNHRHKD